MAKYAIWETYFSALNLVEWGIPEKIQAKCSSVAVKSYDQISFLHDFPIVTLGEPGLKGKRHNWEKRIF